MRFMKRAVSWHLGVFAVRFCVGTLFWGRKKETTHFEVFLRENVGRRWPPSLLQGALRKIHPKTHASQGSSKSAGTVKVGLTDATKSVQRPCI